MRTRLLLNLASVVLVVAACGEGPAPAGEGAVLRYSYQPGDSLTYDTDLHVTMTMTGTGDLGLTGGSEMAMDMSVIASTEYSVEEGPDPETVRLVIETAVLDGTGSVDMAGATQTLSLSDIAAQAGSLDMELVVDSRGEIVGASVGGEDLPPGFLNVLGGSQSSPFAGLTPIQLVGPPLPTEPIGIGTRWETGGTDDPFGLGFEVRSEHEVTGTQVVAGRNTYRIETVTTTDALELTFEDLIRMTEANDDLLADVAADAELQATLAMFQALDIEMIYRLDESITRTTTWIDSEEGIVVRVEASGPMAMQLEMSGIPDTGDIEMHIDIGLDVVMQLAG